MFNCFLKNIDPIVIFHLGLPRNSSTIHSITGKTFSFSKYCWYSFQIEIFALKNAECCFWFEKYLFQVDCRLKTGLIEIRGEVKPYSPLFSGDHFCILSRMNCNRTDTLQSYGTGVIVQNVFGSSRVNIKVSVLLYTDSCPPRTVTSASPFCHSFYWKISTYSSELHNSTDLSYDSGNSNVFCYFIQQWQL